MFSRSYENGRSQVSAANSRTFYISDHHFNHENIIRYAGRPFANVHEMNMMLIHYWNAAVGTDDVVWHVGDFALGPLRAVREIREKLHGTIHLVLGNHDRHKPNQYRQLGFSSVWQKYRDGRRLLVHRPRDTGPWDGVVLHGHTHGQRVYLPLYPRNYNVCVEALGWTPRTWTYIEQAAKRGW